MDETSKTKGNDAKRANKSESEEHGEQKKTKLVHSEETENENEKKGTTTNADKPDYLAMYDNEEEYKRAKAIVHSGEFFQDKMQNVVKGVKNDKDRGEVFNTLSELKLILANSQVHGFDDSFYYKKGKELLKLVSKLDQLKITNEKDSGMIADLKKNLKTFGQHMTSTYKPH